MAGENKSNQSVDFARALVDEGAVVKAVTVLIDCIQKDQYNHEAFCFLGDIYAGAGKPLQAVENYGRAVMLLPTQREYKQKLVFVGL